MYKLVLNYFSLTYIDLETRKRYVDLYVAALEGDWGKAEAIYKDYPDDAVASLSMSQQQLAAISENVQLALLMIQKNKKLAMIYGKLPLPNHQRRTEEKNENRIELLVILIDNNLYDFALLMVEEHPELALLRVKGDGNEIGEKALHALARKPLTFNDHFDSSKQGIWKRCCCHLSGTSMVKNRKMNPKALKLVELLWGATVKRPNYYKISELIEKPWPLKYVAAKEGNIDIGNSK
ncbi:hypothetical protein ACOSQ4_013311 [Xanthoceras sorbifolium]